MSLAAYATYIKDTLYNLVSGLGTQKDPRTSTYYTLNLLDRSILETMYRSDWLARKIVDAPAEDATREWRTWLVDKDDVISIEKIEKKLQVQRKMREALIRARLYGGAAMVLGIDQGQPDEELDLDNIGKDALQFVVVLNRYELNSGPRIYNVDSPYYTRPEYYTVATPMFGFYGEQGGSAPSTNGKSNGKSFVYPYGQSPPQRSATGSDKNLMVQPPSGMITIHPSRVVEFAGNELPDWRLAPMGGGWGDPILQTVEDALKDFGMIISGMASMINDMKMDVVKIPELSQKLSTTELSAKMLERFSLANQAKSTINTLMLDKEEEWDRVQTNFGSTPQLIEIAMQIACAAGGIPVSRAMGSAPNRGLDSKGGSGGEVDIRNYYDAVTAEQNLRYKPKMLPLDMAIVCSALGTTKGRDAEYIWNPLYKPTPAEEAQTALQKAQATQVYIGTGLINEDAMRQAVINQLIEDDVYPGLDDAIDEFGAEPEEPEEPPPSTPPAGMMPKGQFEPNPFKMLAAQQQGKQPQQNKPPQPSKSNGKGGASQFKTASRDFLEEGLADYDPNEPRDEKGQWTSEGGGGAGGGSTKEPSQRRPDSDTSGSRGMGVRPSGGLVFGPVASSQEFHDAIVRSKQNNPYGAAVTAHPVEAYTGMQKFMTPDHKAGVAVDGDDIVSVFRDPTDGKGIVGPALATAVANGGRRLEAFDTVLPVLYAKQGFKAVARLPFDPQYQPPDWNAETFKEYNGGHPDVVFMTYDPEHASSRGGKPVASYDEGVAAQKADLAQRAPAVTNYGLVPGDVEKYKALKSEWSKVNNDLLTYIDKPDSPEAQSRITQLEGIVKQMHGLHADPGTPAGIGLPGGPRDVTIVGAGPGGLAASIFGGAEGLDTLVVESNAVAGGQARYSSRIENFPGFPAGVTGERLTKDMFEQAERLGAETKLGTRVTGMTVDPDGMKHLTLSDGSKIDSRAVILAGGVEFRKAGFPGADGPGVFTGDGKALTRAAEGGDAIVVGGSNGAAQAALGAAQKANHVTLMSRSPIVKGMSDYQIGALANQPKITVIEGDQIAKLDRDQAGFPQSVTTEQGRKIPVKAVGMFIGSVPQTEWLGDLVKRDKAGRISTDGKMETNIPGVFAVGDMREGAIGRVGVAVGEGQMALRESYVYLEGLKKAAEPHISDAEDSIEVTISRLFDLDRDNPWFGQTIDGVKPPRVIYDYDPEEPRDPHGRWTALAGSVGDPGQVSTAKITATGRSVAEREQISKDRDRYQQIGLPLLEHAVEHGVPDIKERLASQFRNNELYPQFRSGDFNGDADHDTRAIIDRFKSNLMALWNDTKPADRENWRRWYVGAHDLITDRMDQYKDKGIGRAAMTGMYAAMSPNTMWDINVHYGDRLLDTVFHHGDDPWDRDMEKASRDMLSNAKANAEGKGEKAKQNYRDMRQKFAEVKAAGSYNKQVDFEHKAAWIKLWNDAHDDSSVREVGIDGKLGAPIKNKGVDENGDPAEMSGAFGSLDRVENALSALYSKGDLNKISDALGAKHKVRSFYNNMLDPHSANGDVTIDTHAGGAALLSPIGSKHDAIGQLFNSATNAPNVGSNRFGIQGTYPLYAEAFREVAKEVHVEPRELQSILWEQKISLFKNAPKARKDAVAAAWQHFQTHPEVTLQQTQQRILRIAHARYNPESRKERQARIKKLMAKK